MQATHLKMHMFIWAILSAIRINSQSFISADICINVYNPGRLLRNIQCCFELAKDYGKCQDLSKSHDEDGPHYMWSNWLPAVGGGWLLIDNILKILHSVTLVVQRPPACYLKTFMGKRSYLWAMHQTCFGWEKKANKEAEEMQSNCQSLFMSSATSS